MRIDTSLFASKKDIHKFIYSHNKAIIASKKSIMKEADCIGIINLTPDGPEQKAAYDIADNATEMLGKLAINTTNIFDSHQDVHIPNIWKKSLKENSRRKHKREHLSGFDNVISSGEDLKAYTETKTFKEIGFKQYVGTTEILIYESTIKQIRNAFMFDQYKNGWVDNHSVGMYYVKLLTAIDDKDYKDEYTNYKKYYPMVANQEDIKYGFFFPVLEAKEIEGSAVTDGSNAITPTISIEEIKSIEQGNHSKREPVPSTRNKSDYFLM